MRVAEVVRPAAAAAVRAVCGSTGAAGRHCRGDGALVDGGVIVHGEGKGAGGFRSFSTHVDDCPNATRGSKASAHAINLLIQLGNGENRRVPFPP